MRRALSQELSTYCLRVTIQLLHSRPQTFVLGPALHLSDHFVPARGRVSSSSGIWVRLQLEYGSEVSLVVGAIIGDIYLHGLGFPLA